MYVDRTILIYISVWMSHNSCKSPLALIRWINSTQLLSFLTETVFLSLHVVRWEHSTSREQNREILCEGENINILIKIMQWAFSFVEPTKCGVSFSFFYFYSKFYLKKSFEWQKFPNSFIRRGCCFIFNFYHFHRYSSLLWFSRLWYKAG